MRACSTVSGVVAVGRAEEPRDLYGQRELDLAVGWNGSRRSLRIIPGVVVDATWADRAAPRVPPRRLGPWLENVNVLRYGLDWSYVRGSSRRVADLSYGYIYLP